MANTPDSKHEPSSNYLDRFDAAFSALGASPHPVRAEAPVDVEHGSTVIADTFAALLAIEEGTPGAKPARLVPAEIEPRVTDALVEAVTNRVVQRLAPEVARAMVADVVSEIAERLVKEEIARIRKGPNA
ncbi:MAG: hypothetical protein HOP16_00945 [Acidobacteria bacterium]|nr:hypothetical protein [Acidobacteriota bacterium]